MGRLSNNQKTFNAVWQHFVVKKKKQSIVEEQYTGETFWALRGPYNRRDAIGLLISDEDYQPEMEKLCVDEIVEAYPDLQLPTKDMTLLLRLQAAHDIVAQSDKEFTERIRANLEQIAKDFDLKLP